MTTKISPLSRCLFQCGALAALLWAAIASMQLPVGISVNVLYWTVLAPWLGGLAVMLMQSKEQQGINRRVRWVPRNRMLRRYSALRAGYRSGQAVRNAK
jgi:putative copper export protein